METSTTKKNNSPLCQIENPPVEVATALRIAVEQKGLDVVGLDVRTYTDITDYMLIASGTSQRHVLGMVDKILEALTLLNCKPNKNSGYEYGDWVILDYVDFVIHVFNQPLRDYYQLEDLWPLAPHVSFPEELERAARKFRTRLE